MAPLPLQNPDLSKNRQGGICHFLNLQEDNIRFILLAFLLYIYLAIGAFIFQAVEETGENNMRQDFQRLYDEFIQNFTNCYYPLDAPPPDLLKGKTFSFGDFSGTQTENDDTTDTSVDDRDEDLEEMGFMKSASEEYARNENDDPFLIALDGLHELLFAYGNATQAGMVWKRKRWDWVGSFHFAWTIVSTIGESLKLYFTLTLVSFIYTDLYNLCETKSDHPFLRAILIKAIKFI